MSELAKTCTGQTFFGTKPFFVQLITYEHLFGCFVLAELVLKNSQKQVNSEIILKIGKEDTLFKSKYVKF